MRLSLAATLTLAVALSACEQRLVFEAAGGAGGSSGGTAGPGGAGGTMGAAGNMGMCLGGSPVTLFQQIADVIVALDRSPSMNGAFGPTSKLLAARGALSNAVRDYQNSVRFGYVGFPDPFGCSGLDCCFIDADAPILRGYDSFADHVAACDSPTAGCVTTNERPIAAALTGCSEVFRRREMLDPLVRNRYILLVTDGPANEEPGCSGSNDECREAKFQVSSLNQVRTYVIGLNTSGQDRCLSDLAFAGNGEYTPVSPNEIEGRVASIVREIASDACQFDVMSMLTDPNDLTLLINNMVVPRGGSNGWDFDGNSPRINLRGDWCNAVMRGDPPIKTIQLVEGCRPSQR